LALSHHNMVGVGDAENDHAFLAMSECAVAVADAIPALRERADYVTRAPGSRGVIEFIEEHLADDLVALVPRLTRHRLPIGEAGDGEPVTIAPHATRLLIVGPSASGKSTLTGLLVERLVESGRPVLLVDPEGDAHAAARPDPRRGAPHRARRWLPRRRAAAREHGVAVPEHARRERPRPGAAHAPQRRGRHRAGGVRRGHARRHGRPGARARRHAAGGG